MKHRTSSAWRCRSVGAAASLVVAATVVAAPAAWGATSLTPPAYGDSGGGTLSSTLRSDIAGSAFVDADGTFHWTTAFTSYNPYPQNAWAKTFTNSDLAAVNSGLGTTTATATAPALYSDPAGMCFQLDKRATNPISSPQEDDHCDVIGVWIDPADGTWHALINDEFQFDPWLTAGASATIDQKIQTGNHNDRILLATSSDKGASWQYKGAALTSGWAGQDGVIDSTTSPATTYPFGNSGCRLFVDYSSGYFYITYNVKIYKKPASSTFATWTGMARAPISGKMASGTWSKYRNGQWTQPGLGGIDGNVGDVPGLTVGYDATSDVVSYSGSPSGQSVNFRTTTVQSDHLLHVGDASGVTYTANTYTHAITRDTDGVVVPQVAYVDPATQLSVNIVGQDDVYSGTTKVSTGGIVITQADPATGASRTQKVNTGSIVLRDPTTSRVYVPFGNNESAISYDAYSGTYRIVGYDGYVYDTDDLGDPGSWQTVGSSPAGSFGGYLTTLDDGSLTNQNVTGTGYLTVSDSSGAVRHVSMTPHTNQTVYTKSLSIKAVDGSTVGSGGYTVSVGAQALGASGGVTPQWSLVPVANPNYPYGSGFYRLKNTTDGSFLQVSGSTPEAQRAFGAAVTAGPQLADAVPSANGGIGAPGGSDQWYVQVVAPNTTSSSSSTSLAGSTVYRLINRNSGLALTIGSNGSPVLAQQSPGAASQYLTFDPTVR